MTEPFHRIICCRCKEPFALLRSSYETLLRNHAIFHCPWGHEQHFPEGESEEDKLRRERDRLIQRQAQLNDEIESQREARERAERQASAYKGQATRVRKRVKHDTCPCCKRTFKQLAAHMANKHPDFVPEPQEREA